MGACSPRRAVDDPAGRHPCLIAAFDVVVEDKPAPDSENDDSLVVSRRGAAAPFTPSVNDGIRKTRRETRDFIFLGGR